MTNKAGFTEEQQKDLTNLIELGQFAAAIITNLCATDLPEGEIERVFREMEIFARATYPRGPKQVAEKMNEISRFCDLAIVTTPFDIDTGKPI